MIWNVLLTSALILGASDFDLRMLDGSSCSGSLVALSSETLTIATREGEMELDVNKLLTITSRIMPPVPAGEALLQIELSDGSHLQGSYYEAGGAGARIGLFPKGDVHVLDGSIHSVRWIQGDRAHSQEHAEVIDRQWEEILDETAAGDMIVIRKIQQRDGREEISLDYLEGVLRDVTADTVVFEFDNRQLNVRRRGKVEGLVYYLPAGRVLPEPVCRVEDAGGSEIRATSVHLANGRLELVSPVGVEFSLPLDVIRKIDFSAGKISFLSDMEPDQVQWTPFLAADEITPLLEKLYQPRRDRNFDGNPLRLRHKDGTTLAYSRGLAIHSRTLLVYRLSGDYRRFTALAGIDPDVGGDGHVRLEILGDDTRLHISAISAASAPMPLDLDIAGVRRLTILVDFGDNLDIADYLNLCEARVAK